MITAFYAAILALIFLALSFRVVQGRFTKRIAFGANGDDDMTKRVRAHGNFAEYVPFALLLLMFAEMQNVPIWSVHAAGIMLVIGRLSHIWGIMSPPPNAQRAVGMVLTFLVILLAALWCVWIFVARLIAGYRESF